MREKSWKEKENEGELKNNVNKEDKKHKGKHEEEIKKN